MGLSPQEELELLQLEEEESSRPQSKSYEPDFTPTSKMESVARGAGKGITFGFQPELSAIVEKGAAKLDPWSSRQNYLDMYGDKGIRDLSQSYKQENLLAEKSNPEYFKGAEMVSSIPTASIVTGGVGAIPGIANAGLTNIVGSALTGGLMSAGDSEKQGVDRLKDVPKGAAIGAVTAGAFEQVTPTIQRMAQNLATRAAGFSSKFLKKTFLPGGVDQGEEIGKNLLDQGVIKPFQSLKKFSERISDLKDRAGKQIGDTLDRMGASDAGIVDMNKVENNFMKSYENPQDFPLDKVKEVIQEYKNMAPFDESGASHLPLKRAQELKKRLADLAWKNGAEKGSAEAEAARNAYFAVRDEIDNGVRRASIKTGNPQVSKDFMQAKKNYLAASKASIALEDKMAKAAGGKKIGLEDIVLGTHSLPLAITKKVIESKGSQVGAYFLNKGAKFLTNGGMPSLTAPITKNLLSNNPLDFGTVYSKDQGGNNE